MDREVMKISLLRLLQKYFIFIIILILLSLYCQIYILNIIIKILINDNSRLR